MLCESDFYQPNGEQAQQEYLTSLSEPTNSKKKKEDDMIENKNVVEKDLPNIIKIQSLQRQRLAKNKVDNLKVMIYYTILDNNDKNDFDDLIKEKSDTRMLICKKALEHDVLKENYLVKRKSQLKDEAEEDEIRFGPLIDKMDEDERLKRKKELEDEEKRINDEFFSIHRRKSSIRPPLNTFLNSPREDPKLKTPQGIICVSEELERNEILNAEFYAFNALCKAWEIEIKSMGLQSSEMDVISTEITQNTLIFRAENEERQKIVKDEEIFFYRACDKINAVNSQGLFTRIKADCANQLALTSSSSNPGDHVLFHLTGVSPVYDPYKCCRHCLEATPNRVNINNSISEKKPSMITDFSVVSDAIVKGQILLSPAPPKTKKINLFNENQSNSHPQQRYRPFYSSDNYKGEYTSPNMNGGSKYYNINSNETYFPGFLPKIKLKDVASSKS